MTWCELWVALSGSFTTDRPRTQSTVALSVYQMSNSEGISCPDIYIEIVSFPGSQGTAYDLPRRRQPRLAEFEQLSILANIDFASVTR